MESISFFRGISVIPTSPTTPNDSPQPPPNNQTRLLTLHPNTPLSFADLSPDHNVQSDAATPLRRDSSLNQGQLSYQAHLGIRKLHLSNLLKITDSTALPPPADASLALRRHQSIVTATAPHSWLPHLCLPTDHHSTFTNGEMQFNTQLRLAEPFAAALSLSICPRCRDTPSTHGGWHFCSSCKHSQIGVLEHTAVQAVIHQSFKSHTYAAITEQTHGLDTSPDNRHTDLKIAVFGQPSLFVDVSSTCPFGVTNQHLINRRLSPRSHPPSNAVTTPLIDPRERLLVAATAREASKVAKHEPICLANDSTFLPFVLETTGGFGPRTFELETLYRNAIDMRRSADDLPVDLLLAKFRKDIAFALRKATYATVTGAVRKLSSISSRDWRASLQTHSADVTLRLIFADPRFTTL